MTATTKSPLKVADEVWIATALLHREHPKASDFSLEEIVESARKEGLHEPLRPGVYVHVVQHCVANRPPNPGRYRVLIETGTSSGTEIVRKTLLRTIRCFPYVAPANISGLTNMPMSTCGACGKAGNEPGFLGHECIYLSAGRLRTVVRARSESEEQNAGSRGSACYVHANAGRNTGEANRSGRC